MYRLEKIDTNKVCLEVEVPKEEVNQALEKAYRKIVKKVNLPGFRKGKVPRKILEARFGPEILYEEALEELLDPAYARAVKDCKLEPINQPQLELVQMEKDKPLIFKVTVDIKPEVELGQYRGVVVKQLKREITPVDVERYLQSLREQHARLVTLEEGELKEKDLAVIDFQGTIEGQPFEGGEVENYSLEIGSGTFLKGFEEQLLGARRGEEREIKVTFPDDYHYVELAGKEATFKVKVKEIKRPQLPELDDNFVQELTEEFSTLEEFKADIEKSLKEDLERRKKIELESMIIEKVAEESKVDVPDVLVEREIDSILSDFEYYLRLQGLSLEQYGNMIEGGLEKLREERRPKAEKRAKANLVLDAIIKKEGIEATEEEVEEKIKEIAGRQNVDIEKAKELFTRQGRRDIIAHEIRYRKVIDLLVEHAQVLEVEAQEEAADGEKAEKEGKVIEGEEEARLEKQGDDLKRQLAEGKKDSGDATGDNTGDE